MGNVTFKISELGKDYTANSEDISFDMDRNSTKIYQSGRVSIDMGGTMAKSFILPHSLGYAPMVFAHSYTHGSRLPVYTSDRDGIAKAVYYMCGPNDIRFFCTTDGPTSNEIIDIRYWILIEPI